MSLAILDALTPRCYPRAMPMPHATPGRTLMPVLMAIRVHAFLLPHPPSHSQPPHTDYRFPLRPAYVTPSGCVAGAHLHDKEYAAPCPDPRLMSMIPRMQRRITLQSAMDWARDLDFVRSRYDLTRRAPASQLRVPISAKRGVRGQTQSTSTTTTRQRLLTSTTTGVSRASR